MKFKPKWEKKRQRKAHKGQYPQGASEVYVVVGFLDQVSPDFTTLWNWQRSWRQPLSSRIFFSKMRSRNEMPTVLESGRLFAPTIRQSLKQLTEDTGFLYYTSPSSYDEAPETMKLAFRALPSVPCPSSTTDERLEGQLWKACAAIDDEKPKHQR